MPTSQHRATRKRARAAPWERPAPAKVARKRPTKLTSTQKAHAKARAKKAGRHYPNLVDNMHEAAATKAPKKKPSRTRTARKKASGSGSATRRKSTTRRPTERTGATRKTGATKRATKRGPRAAKKAATGDPRGR